MNRFCLSLIMGTIVVLSLGESRARAQLGTAPTQPYSGPTVSPYLGLRTGVNPALSYYTNVRPNQEFSAYIQQSQQMFRQVEAASSNTQEEFTQEFNRALPSTGQGAGFMTHQAYFMTNRVNGFGGPSGIPTAGAMMTAMKQPTAAPVATAPTAPTPPSTAGGQTAPAGSGK
jgi:hypothetical protein